MPMMIDEIKEQPKVVQAVLKQERTNIEALCKTVRSRDISCVIIAARGTSDHAATVTKYLMEIVNGIPVSLAAPSVVTLYRSRMNLSKALVIGISQSGQAADVLEYVSQAKSCRALTVGISNDPDSELSKVCEYSILCHAGEERSVAATKTYTASIACCAMLSFCLSGSEELKSGLERVPDAIDKALETEKQILEIAPRYRYMQECYTLARGVNHATAYEAALKISETCYIGARAFSTADFMHGPIAVVEEGTSCFVFAPEGKALSNVVQTVQTLAQKRAETIVFSNSERALEKATIPVRLEVSVHEYLSPIVYIVPAQLFACHLAIVRGNNPDRPRGLSKVTLTR